VRDSRGGRLLLALLLVAALVLLTLDYRARGADSRLGDGVASVVGPVERGVSAVTRPVRRAVGSLGQADKQRARADALEQQVGTLRRQVAADADARRVAAELARLRLAADKAAFTIVPARVIGAGGVTGSEQVVDLDAGTGAGVAVGQLVVVADGLVGVVVRAVASTSTVRLASDPMSVVGARLEATRALGTVTGTGATGQLGFTLFDPTVPIRAGERVVTFGSGDYPGGVPVGLVTGTSTAGDGLSRRASVRTYAGFGRLDLVGVVVRHAAADSGDRLLPPRGKG